MKSLTLSQINGKVARLWKRACDHDRIDPSSSFVSFTPTNPHVPELNRLMALKLKLIGGSRVLPTSHK